MLERRATGVEGAEQIDVDDGLESVGGHAENGSRKISGRSADYEIDLAVLIARSLDRRRQRVVVTHIGRMSRRHAIALSDFRRRIIELLLRTPNQRNLRPILRVPPRNREVDPAAAAGNDGSLPSKHFLSKHSRHLRKPKNVRALQTVDAEIPRLSGS
jgi:hypothetical protein